MNTHHFQHATALFYEADYQSALRAINQHLELKPPSSMAFNNRGLIHLRMGQLTMARQDIDSSIMLNHLNYVAYFNLFSLEAGEKHYEAALLALRGAISSLYLIKGRLLKDKHLLSKAIEHSTNNIDGLILLVLLEVRDGNYEKAIILIEAAKTLKENQGILQKLGGFINKLKSNYQVQDQQALFDYLIEATPQHHHLSGKTLLNEHVAQEELKMSLDEKVVEFNELYKEINVRVGGASYLIAKTPEKMAEIDVQHVDREARELTTKPEVMAQH